MRIAVLVPCRDEAPTVRGVVEGFRHALPEAEIYVYDNGSSDDTARRARTAGATVCDAPQLGKGNVVRQMFREVDADIYVLVDGDGTYDPTQVRALIDPVAAGQADMVVGSRISSDENRESFPRFHWCGNHLFGWTINRLFSANMVDVLSGYRVFNRRFVKTLPLVARGFEVETQMTLQALHYGFSIVEIPTPYRDRPDGSESKLRTYRDGVRILAQILRAWRAYRPLPFFGVVALVMMVAAWALPWRAAEPVVVMWCGLGGLTLLCGLVVDAVGYRLREVEQLAVLRLEGGTEPRRRNRDVAFGPSTPLRDADDDLDGMRERVEPPTMAG